MLDSLFLTIHELDHLKKGHSMIARNARESIRFIDLMISTDDYDIHDEKLMLETPEDTGPSWKKCLTFKSRSPKVTEFPDYQPSYEIVNGLSNASKLKKDGEIMYEQDLLSHDEEDEEGQDVLAEERKKHNRRNRPRVPKAELPNRYKYLLRPLIQKAHVDEVKWKFVTDDPIVKIWCESFGIICLNVIEADSELFTNSLARNVASQVPIETSLSNLTLKGEISSTPRSLVGQSEESNRSKARGRKRNNNKKKQALENKVDNDLSAINVKNVDGSSVRIEKYDSISYAPRGTGELWVP
ncbi:hypothetical protein WICPIJ_008763 [Wickerhamomyces pijperi]|uniref:Uncharacterized protein n=1 Tax=Wickerhamomyces pijperi TaxID=599730 RepID=A0A9P8THK7_WICPI|nr:hypothetical protein WICPIJ_008763 [Wickerhamomyces pijperi]